jgi:hypothetical protein
MLSRYRSGLDRGRTIPAESSTHDPASSTAPAEPTEATPSDLPDLPNRGVQE